MKIAHWNQRFYPLKGGVESHIAAIVDGMREHQFEIITNMLPNTSKKEKYLENATIIRFPPKDYFRAMKKEVSWKINYSYSATAEMLRTKRQKKYLINSESEIIHVHDVDSSLMRLSANTGFESLGKISDNMYDLSEIKKPIIMTKHFLYSESLPKQYHDLELQLLNQMDEIICVSKKIEKKVREMVPNKKVWHIPNFVDTDRFKPLSLEQREKIRKSMNLQDKIVGIFVGRITEGKGLENLLNAWAIAVKKNKNLTLIVVGDGPKLDVYKNMAIDIGIKNNVMFTGFTDSPENNLQMADFYLQVSESEGLSISLLEAMSCGLPVIATDVGGTREVISSDKIGWLLQPGDSSTLSLKILELIDNYQMFNNESIREVILKNYDLANNVKKISNIYHKFNS